MHIYQPGDCFLFSGDSFVSRGIKWFTNSEWSHVAMYVGGGEGYVIEATAAGVEKNKLDSLTKHATKYCARRIPRLTVEQSENMKTAAYSMIASQDPYDFIQLASLGLYFGIRKIFGKAPAWLVKNTKNSMICSELFAVCALTIPLKFAKQTKLVTPATLFDTDLMETVYMFESN